MTAVVDHDQEQPPSVDVPWWTSSDVARYLGVQLRTVTAYRNRGQMPTPDGRIGSRPAWLPATITEWRPGTATDSDGRTIRFGG